MGKTLPPCDQPAANAVYKRLKELAKENFLPKALNLDGGFPVLNYKYKEQSEQKEKTVGKGDNALQCEEIWETGLSALDSLGEAADWEEDLTLAKDDDHKKAIQRYQKFRELVECSIQRPVPWVFEAPYICKGSAKKKQRASQDKTKLKEAKELRKKVRGAIKKIRKLLANENLSRVQYQQCLIACLYWFVVAPEGGDDGPLQLVSFFEKQKVSSKVINKMTDEFSEYLRSNGGGLGLADIKDDAIFEATALMTTTVKEIDPETGLLVKRGWCTEQSKVMYAVLRMAGIEAFFVEPSLSVEYKIAKAKPEEKEKLKRLTETPLLGHMAAGVAVKIRDKNGREGVWIIDVTSRLLEADYIQDNPGLWEARPYWELSLRHFYMADLANLGFDQMNQGDFSRAERSLRMALNLGDDSTSFHAAGNLAYLLSRKLERLSCRSKDVRKACKDLEEAIDQLSKTAAENPYSPVFLFNRGKFLLYKHNVAEAVEAFFQAMDADPRYILPYQKLRKVIDTILEYGPEKFVAIWGVCLERMRGIAERHPLLWETVKKGLEKMKPKKNPRKKLSPKEEKVIELIDELIRESNL